MQRSLLLPKEKQEFFIRLNVDGLLRGDYQSRMNGYSVARQNGWLSANNIREMEDMNQSQMRKEKPISNQLQYDKAQGCRFIWRSRHE